MLGYKSIVKYCAIPVVPFLIVACLKDQGLTKTKAEYSLLGEGGNAKTTTYEKKQGEAATACGQRLEQLKGLNNSGYVYAAVPDAVCGTTYKLTFLGGCLETDVCLRSSDGVYAELDSYAVQPSTTTLNIVVVDTCYDTNSCLNGLPHIDIGHFALAMDPVSTMNLDENTSNTNGSWNDGRPSNNLQTPHKFNFYTQYEITGCINLEDDNFIQKDSNGYPEANAGLKRCWADSGDASADFAEPQGEASDFSEQSPKMAKSKKSLNGSSGARVGGYTCQQQKDWGKCGESWMSPVCDSVCKGPTKTKRNGGSSGGGMVGGYTCQQQKSWGKCGQSWMSPVCDSVCKGSSTSRPSGGSSGGGMVGGYTCQQQKDWGKCGQSWMSPVCDSVCKGSSSSGGGMVGGYTCQQQKDWGKCGQSWMSPVCDSVCKK
jgi:hypothetical protein